MTDVPSKHVWKIKESRIVFKDFDILKGNYKSRYTTVNPPFSQLRYHSTKVNSCEFRLHFAGSNLKVTKESLNWPTAVLKVGLNSLRSADFIRHYLNFSGKFCSLLHVIGHRLYPRARFLHLRFRVGSVTSDQWFISVEYLLGMKIPASEIRIKKRKRFSLAKGLPQNFAVSVVESASRVKRPASHFRNRAASSS